MRVVLSRSTVSRLQACGPPAEWPMMLLPGDSVSRIAVIRWNVIVHWCAPIMNIGRAIGSGHTDGQSRPTCCQIGN